MTNEERVFEEIRRKPDQSRFQLANRLHLNEEEIRDALRKLEQQGLIEKTGDLLETRL